MLDAGEIKEFLKSNHLEMIRKVVKKSIRKSSRKAKSIRKSSRKAKSIRKSSRKAKSTRRKSNTGDEPRSSKRVSVDKIQVNGSYHIGKLTNNHPMLPRTIFVFSDRHESYKDKSCRSNYIQADEVIVNLIAESNPSMVDFYIELDIYSEDSYRVSFIEDTGDQMMREIWKRFKDCYTNYNIEVADKKIKPDCKIKWPNLRYHYSDVRVDHRRPKEPLYKVSDVYDHPTVFKVSSTLLHRLTLVLFQIENYSQSANKSMLHTVYELVSAYKTILEPYPTSEKYYSAFFETERMKKQLSKINVAHLKDRLQRFIIDKSRIPYENMMQYIRKIVSSKDVNSEIINELRNHVILASLYTMDAYLLARMFKLMVPSQERVIIYAGGLHIENYIDFLRSIGYTYEGYGHKFVDHKDSQYFCVELPRSFLMW